MKKAYGMYGYGKLFVMSGIWSKRPKKSGIMVSVCSNSSLLIFMFYVTIQNEPRKTE